jgi:8-oxo-dGTP pyrophosphatase MutT (NUDIX family)
MSLLAKTLRCNARNLMGYVPFYSGGAHLGFVTPARADVLMAHADVFRIESGQLSFHQNLRTPEMRTHALAEIAPDLAKTGAFSRPRGELYAAKNSWHDPAQFLIDRAHVVGFGLRAYGVHINGYVRKPDGLHLWIGTRAMNSAVEPGKLDNMVAGGQPYNLSLMDNVIKECAEEAGLTPSLAGCAQPTGQLSYAFDTPQGLRADTLFCFDLEMPDNQQPMNKDGEITGFALLPLDHVLHLVATSERFKFNVNLVLIDFAIRHGAITPDQSSDYEQLVSGLHERPKI